MKTDSTPNPIVLKDTTYTVMDALSGYVVYGVEGSGTLKINSATPSLPHTLQTGDTLTATGTVTLAAELPGSDFSGEYGDLESIPPVQLPPVPLASGPQPYPLPPAPPPGTALGGVGHKDAYWIIPLPNAGYRTLIGFDVPGQFFDALDAYVWPLAGGTPLASKTGVTVGPDGVHRVRFDTPVTLSGYTLIGVVTGGMYINAPSASASTQVMYPGIGAVDARRWWADTPGQRPTHNSADSGDGQYFACPLTLIVSRDVPQATLGPSLSSGNTASRPTLGAVQTGLHINTETDALDYWTGTAWKSVTGS